MYRSNGTSSMATLMQTSNCMKTLANGGLGADSSVMGVNDQPMGGVDGGGHPPMTRALLPHEMASLPMAQTHQTQTPAQLPYNNNFGYYNSIHHHHSSHHTSHHHQPMLLPHQQQSINNASPANASANSVHTSSASHLPHLQTHHQQHHQHHTSSGTSSHHTTSSSSSQMTTAGGHGSSDLDRLADGGGGSADDKHNSPASNTDADATAAAAAAAAAAEAEQEPEPEIDIVINNVVCSFSVRCHLNLREIALNGVNVEFRRENGMVTMKLRRPYTTASIWSSGRITCTGATSEDQAKVAARRYARCLEKLGFNVRFNNFRVVNVLGTCSMPWAIKIVNFSEKYKKDASYEPELHPGVTYKLKWPKATLKIFSTGSITVTASSVNNVQAAIEHIFPLVYEFRKKRAPDDPKLLKANAMAAAAAAAKAEAAEKAAATMMEDEGDALTHQNPLGHASNDSIMSMSDVDDDDLIEEDYTVDDEEEIL